MHDEPSRTRAQLSRRGFLTAVGAVGAGLALAACTSDSGSTTNISIYVAKPEVIASMQKLIAQFNSEQSKVHVTVDSTSSVPADFVRGGPPDLGFWNYNFSMVEFVTHGALLDLADTEAAKSVEPSLWPMVNVVAEYPGRKSVIPYSVITEGVIYNKDIFDQHGINDVPTTWSEFVQVCEKLQQENTTPIYSTYGDAWTIAQGMFDYTIGGLVDIPAFFDAITKEGTKITPTSKVSFSKDFRPAMEKMLTLMKYSNTDAASRHYGDGNTAFAQGKAAMYLQGPWAFSQIALTNANMNLGTFPLPVTEDPKDLKVRLDLDIALWIPQSLSPRKADAAMDLLNWLWQPKIADAYNNANDGYSSRVGAPAPTNPALDGMKQYYDAGEYYMGMSQLLPAGIPVANYAQAIALGSSIESQLALLDNAWARYSYLPS